MELFFFNFCLRQKLTKRDENLLLTLLWKYKFVAVFVVLLNSFTFSSFLRSQCSCNESNKNLLRQRKNTLYHIWVFHVAFVVQNVRRWRGTKFFLLFHHPKSLIFVTENFNSWFMLILLKKSEVIDVQFQNYLLWGISHFWSKLNGLRLL